MDLLARKIHIRHFWGNTTNTNFITPLMVRMFALTLSVPQPKNVLLILQASSFFYLFAMPLLVR